MRERLKVKKFVPLTEGDIQKRLYGEFHTKGETKEPASGESQSPPEIDVPAAPPSIFKSSIQGLHIPRRIILMILLAFLVSIAAFERVLKRPAAKVPVRDTTTEAQGRLPSKSYTIQACVYVDKSGADKRTLQLKDKGYPAFVLESKSAKGKTLYKICVGEFASAKEASPLLVRLQTEERLKDSYLRRR